MRRLASAVICQLLLAPLILATCMLSTSRAYADECTRGSLRGNIVSHGDQAELSVNGRVYECSSPTPQGRGSVSGPVYTFEVLCDPESEQGPGTLCSVAPCLQENQSFALRSIRSPGGQVSPAGHQCLDTTETEAAPGLTFAQVFAAIRSVKLPGGRIHTAPATRGLANLSFSFGWKGLHNRQSNSRSQDRHFMPSLE
jgi:hypothetical protein